MNRIFWTARSLEDLQEISACIESQRNVSVANRVCRSIYNAVQQLRRFPETGKAGLEDGTRELVISDFPVYSVAYRVVPHQTVEILRVWHGARQRSGPLA